MDKVLDFVLDFVLDAPVCVARWIADRLQSAFEFACLAAAAVGVFVNWGRGWGLIASGVLGVVWLELDELLVLIASRRRSKK